MSQLVVGAKPNPSLASKIDTIEGWLKTMNLEEYWPTFKQKGLNVLESINDINENTLDTMRIVVATGFVF